MKNSSRVACAAALIGLSVPAIAHHSFAMFDFTKEGKVSGTVESFQWTNPHAWLDLRITADDGTEEVWHFEAASPLHLSERGWRSTSMQPGDEVTITMRPLKNGQPAGQLVDATLADGTFLSAGGPPAGSGAGGPPGAGGRPGAGGSPGRPRD